MAKKKKRHTYTGILSKHRKGFGFVACDDIEDDVFIAAGSMHGAMNGDEVEIDLIPEYLWRDSPEAIITKVLHRNTTEVVGTFDKSKKFGFVIPESKKQKEDIFIRKKDFSGAKKGDKVVVQITRYPDQHNSAEGRISEIISRAGQPGGDIKAIARTYDMRETFPSRANAEAKAMKRQGVRQEDIQNRKDLRGKHIFTIDGADSKDFDDAVSLDILPNGNYMLGVHIADVSHYVKEDGPLDKEALKRGTSVYLLNQVIPMLPKALSNDICSLNPYEDRLTLSVDMELTPEGTMVNHEIYESVIRSAARFVYDDVSDLLEDGKWQMGKKYEPFQDDLLAMHKLAVKLEEKRRERGSIDFDLDESEIRLNDKGIPVSVEIAQRRSANKMIEEFMLLANETVAEDYYWQEMPFVYRVHEAPDDEKIRALATFINNFGFSMHIGANEVRPKEIQKLLGKVEGTPQEALISRLALRSMKQARYTPENSGHFGLAANYYTHFTSPIRRYPDLQIHRIIKDNLRGRMNGERMEHYRKILEEVTKHASETERRADEAERETVKLKKVEYMSDRIGNVYTGVISGVTKWGMYVELPNTIEGLIHVANMRDDHYNYDESRYEMVGERTGKVYKLGQEVRVRVADTDRLMRTIDFVIAKERDEENGEDEW